MQDVLIFANPISGRGRGRDIAARLEHRLRADGYQPRLFLEHAGKLAKDDVSHPARAAVVIGGDGTLRTVADRLISLGTVPPPLLPIGLGTANLMARHLGLRWTDESVENTVSAAIGRHQLLQLDAGRANGKLFLLMVGVGFDAHIVHELDRLRTGPISLVNYLEPAARALGGYRFQSLRVTVDGSEAWRKQPGLAFVGNVKEYGTMFPVIPHARPDDGLLDVCLLPCRDHVDLIKLFLHAAAGEHMMAEGAVYLRGKNIRIESQAPMPVQIDGDPGGYTPVDIDLLPFRLPFIVPLERLGSASNER
jgi:diacylglycerol kinase (ATP)